MSIVLKRVATIGAALGSAIVLTAGAAGAGSSSSIVASVPGSARAGASTPASVDSESSTDVTGSAAAGVGFRVYNGQCFSNDVSFTADTYETGFSGVRQFRQLAQLQERLNSGQWVNRTSVASVTSARFPNDGRNIHFVRDWDGNHTANAHSWRVRWQGKYYNGAGNQVAQTKVILVNCF